MYLYSYFNTHHWGDSEHIFLLIARCTRKGFIQEFLYLCVCVYRTIGVTHFLDLKVEKSENNVNVANSRPRVKYDFAGLTYRRNGTTYEYNIHNNICIRNAGYHLSHMTYD